MGTQAALDNPRCRHDDPRYGPYGRFDNTETGNGPVCVKEWKTGSNNGGATSPGVTKDTVKLVVVVPNATQLSSDPVKPSNRATGQTGTYPDAIHDYLRAITPFFETWGRDLDVEFVVSSGDDEASQRADAVTVKAMKPFAALVMFGAPQVLEGELAKAGIVTMGYAATAEQSQAQAPFRWGMNDFQAGALAAADMMGKQLVGKAAEYGGDDVKTETRRFGVVYDPTLIDIDAFKAALAEHGGKVVTEMPITGLDATALQQQAPTMTAKMRDAGVTTVVQLVVPTAEFMKAAESQDWTPEWLLTATAYQDLAILARGNPPEQAKHLFGLSFLAPYVQPDPTPAPPARSYSQQIDPLNWYWGLSEGSFTSRIQSPFPNWLLAGIHGAGPNLTPKTFRQALFATPAAGGSADGRVDTNLHGFGKTVGLPYDSYSVAGYDYAPVWYDPDTTGPSNATGTVGKGVTWYADGARRYTASEMPTKPMGFFQPKTSVLAFDTRPTTPLGYAGDCSSCPSATGAERPGAPSQSGYIISADGTSSLAS